MNTKTNICPFGMVAILETVAMLTIVQHRTPHTYGLYNILKSTIMNTKKELTKQEFKKQFCTTLQTEPSNPNRLFIKIELNDYADLGILQYYLINAITLIAQAHEYNEQPNESLSFTIQAITRILQEIQTQSEYEGIDSLIKL